MKQPTAKTKTDIYSSPENFLRAIYGYWADELDRELVNTAWQLAYSVLWNDQHFSAKEKEEAKAYIKQWLDAPGGNSLAAFKNFCQRIILALEHLKTLNQDLLALPSLWFDTDNAEGYAATGELLEAVQSIRHSLPNYRQELKALAEAVIELKDESTAKNFQYWRNYFIEKENDFLLNILSVYAANLHFKVQ